MAVTPERKLFLGPRLRRLRRELGLTQTRMAEDLGVSPSYLNHLERNQRPVTAQVLLHLAEAYDIDIRSLSSDHEAAGARDLTEVFADPLFRDLGVARHEVAEAAENTPGVADAIVRLYRAYADRRRLTELGGAPRAEEGDTGLSLTPSDWVRDYIQGQRNFFPELDEAGERMAEELKPEPQGFAAAARQRLADRHGVQVRIVPTEVLPDSVRRYDHHRRRLMLFTQTAATIVAVGLAVVAFRGLHRVWPIYVLAALGSAVGAFDLPARNALVPSLVPREHLPNAISLNTIMFQTASVVGPSTSSQSCSRETDGER